MCPETKFSLCFDEHVDGPQLAEAFKTKADVILEIDEEDDETSEEESDEETPIDHGMKKSLVEDLQETPQKDEIPEVEDNSETPRAFEAEPEQPLPEEPDLEQVEHPLADEV